MGRHSDPDPRWFWLSLGAAAAKAMLGLLLVAVVVFGLTRWGRQETGSGADLAQGPVVATAPSGTPSEDGGGEPEDDEGAAIADEPALEEPSEEADGGDEAPVLATVQVLNASGDPDALDEVIAVLEDLGYQVVASGRAARGYERTTVFWSDGERGRAQALRREDGRFGVLEANERLDPTIQLHVVIGADWDAEE